MAKLTIPSEELLTGGHVACQGCGAALAMRLLLKGLGSDTVLVIPACCWAVIPGPMPGSCLNVSTVFSAFEATAAMASGVKAGLRRTGRGNTTVVAFAGDGGTADIGIQALSGAAERDEDILYVCYDNEAYMNTGIQRSGLTPPAAWTTTTPKGLEKRTGKKDMPEIMAAHGISYVATANPSFPEDLVAKAKKAREMKGTRYLHILADCPTGWKHDPAKMVDVGRLATTSLIWPLYEIENGVFRITWAPASPHPVEKYLRSQGRFRQMSPADIEEIQRRVDARWKTLKARESPAAAGHVEKAVPPTGPVHRPMKPLPQLPPETPRALTADAYPRCYKEAAKVCDGSCGKLMLGGVCSELWLGEVGA